MFVTGDFTHVTPLNPQSVELATARHLSHLFYGLHSPSLQTSRCGATRPFRALGKEMKAEGSEVKTIPDYTGARSQPGLHETLQTSAF